MNASSISRVAAFGLGAFALAATPANAAPVPSTATFEVQSVLTNASGSLVANELLNIAWLDGRAAITVEQQNIGAYARLAAPIDANGVLAIATSDPAVTCYNSAQSILAGVNAKSESALAVSFGGSNLSIPLHLAAMSPADGVQDVTIGGRLEGMIEAPQQEDAPVAIVVDGMVRTQQHQLMTIELRETTVLASTHAAIGQTSCSITRVLQAAPGTPA